MHRILRVIRIFIFIILPVHSFSQSIDISAEKSRVTFPSPTAASLGKYGEYPVSLYTGQINIDVPLLEISSGNLSLPISLSYNGSGNKVSDIPGWVGLGWSLNAGGVITRIVKNLPDDSYPSGYYHDRSSFNYQISLQEPQTNYAHEAVNRRHDLEPDVFLFNFAGHTGKFHIDNHGIPRIESAEKLKVEFVIGDFSHSAYSFFDSFTITTKEGTKYIFEQKEWSLTGLSFPSNSENHISSWYLTKMENLSGDNITFKYTTADGKYRFQERTYDKMIFISNGGGYDKAGRVSSLSIDEVIYLDEINFSNGKLKFPKSKNNEFYYIPYGYNNLIAEEKKLDNIIFYDKNDAVVKKWEFHYLEQTERLKIQSIRELSSTGSQNQAYQFEYNPKKLPVAVANGDFNIYDSNSIDYWGYYNGAYNPDDRIPITEIPEYNTTIGTANRTPNAESMKADILTKIQYPTGGYTKFEFEPHQYGNQMSGPIEANYEWVGPLSFFYEERIFDNDPSTIQFTLNETSVVKTTRSSINIGPNRQWLPSGSESKTYTLPAGTYTLADIFNTNDLLNNGSSDIQTATGSIQIRKKVSRFSSMGGGLRIKSTETFDGKDIVKKEYEYTDGSDSAPTGTLSGFPRYFKFLNEIWVNINGYMMSSNPIEEFPYGPLVSYHTVKEKFSDGSKIVHHYMGHYNYADDEGISYSPLESSIKHPISNNDLRGLETTTEFFSSSGIKVKEIINSYTVHPDSIVNIPAIDNKIIFIGNAFQSSGDEGYTMSKYTIPSRFVYEKDSKEILYSPSGVALTNTQTDFSYENSKHFQVTKIATKNSKGETTEKKLMYPHDMVLASRDPNGVYQGMINKNLINPIIEEVSKINSNQVKLGRVNYYQPFANIFVPKSLESQAKTTDPVKTILYFNKYDIKGNLLNKSEDGGLKTSYIWSYNNQLPVAEIKNSDYATVENAVGGAAALANFNVLPFPSTTQTTNLFNMLRSSLSGTFITTYTYDPISSLTSQTDAKGQTTYYEYDEFQRLKNVKDQNGNIIKNNIYHYKP